MEIDPIVYVFGDFRTVVVSMDNHRDPEQK